MVRRLGGPRLGSAILIDAVGSGAVIPLGVLFFTIHQRMAVTTVGLGLTIGGATSLITSPLTGQAIDRLGPRRALLLGWSVSALTAASWLLVHQLWSLALLETVQGAFGGMIWNGSATFLAARSDEGDISRVMATNYSLRNLGMGAGGLLSTLALSAGRIGFVLAVGLNVLSYLAGALLVLGVPAPARAATESEEEDDPTTIWTVLRDRRYVGLALANGLIAFNQMGLQVILPLWIVLDTRVPHPFVGLLFTLNTALVVVGQLWFSNRVRELPDAPRGYRLTAGAMLASAGAFLLAHLTGEAAGIALLVLGTTLLTVCEMAGSSCSFVVSMRLAREAHRGKYLSVFGMGWGIEGTAGPLVGTALVASGILLPWLAIAALVGLGAGASVGLVAGAID